METLGREPLDAARGSQRIELEPQLLSGFFFRRTLTIQFLDLVAVPQQLEVLPRGKEQRRHEEHGNARSFPQFAQPGFVDFADHGIVADVFFDGVFERLHHVILSAARNFALRARGLRATSSSVGTSGFFVSTSIPAPPRSSLRSVCFTMRSSSEWNVMTTSRAATVSLLAATSMN